MSQSPPRIDARWESPARQARVAMLFIALKFLWRAIRQAWPLFLIVYIRGGAADGVTRLIYLALIITGIQLVTAIIAWFRFTFYIQEDELVVNQGLFSLKRSGIPLTRIQSLQFEQNLFHRQFNVVKVKVETAGSKTVELSLDALERPRAEALRSFILKRKAVLQKEIEPEPLTEGDETVGAAGDWHEQIKAESNRTQLLGLTVPAVLYVGLTRNHLRTAAFILGGLVTFYQFVGDLDLVPQLEQLIERLIGIAPQTVGQFLLLGGILLAIASVIGSIIQSALRYYDLNLSTDDQGFHLSAGLFNRREQLMRHEKLQYLRFSQNPLQARFRLWAITLFQVGGTAAAKQSMRVLGADEAARQRVREYIFPAEATENLKWNKVHPRVIRRMFIQMGILPTLLIGGFLIPQVGWWGLLILIWLGPSYLLARRYYREFRFAMDDAMVRVQSAFFVRSDTQLWLYKVQTVDVSQSIFQQRLGYGDLNLHLAAGSVTIPYLPLVKAQELRDFILYQVEVSRENWM